MKYFLILSPIITQIHNQDNWPKTLIELEEKIKKADGVIFVTPEYNFSVPGYLKNCIDWFSLDYLTNL